METLAIQDFVGRVQPELEPLTYIVNEPPAPLPNAAITGRMHSMHGQKIMLDRVLAELYGVQGKALKQAVRRNMERFQEDFMFELTLEEDRALRVPRRTSFRRHRCFASTSRARGAHWANLRCSSVGYFAPVSALFRASFGRTIATGGIHSRFFEVPLRSQFVILKQGEHAKYALFAFTEYGTLMHTNVLRSEQAITPSIHIVRVFTRMRELFLSSHGVVAKLKGTSKNLAPAASARCVAPSGAWLFVIHTSLILGRILRFSIHPSSRLVRTKNTHACHPFEVLRSTLKELESRMSVPDEEIRAIFFRSTSEHLAALVSPAEKSRRPIGFEPTDH